MDHGKTASESTAIVNRSSSQIKLTPKIFIIYKFKMKIFKLKHTSDGPRQNCIESDCDSKRTFLYLLTFFINKT